MVKEETVDPAHVEPVRSSLDPSTIIQCKKTPADLTGGRSDHFRAARVVLEEDLALLMFYLRIRVKTSLRSLSLNARNAMFRARSTRDFRCQFAADVTGLCGGTPRFIPRPAGSCAAPRFVPILEIPA